MNTDEFADTYADEASASSFVSVSLPPRIGTERMAALEARIEWCSQPVCRDAHTHGVIRHIRRAEEQDVLYMLNYNYNVRPKQNMWVAQDGALLAIEFIDGRPTKRPWDYCNFTFLFEHWQDQGHVQELAKRRWHAGDTVQFTHNGRVIAGIIARMNPTKALVAVSGSLPWHVPYNNLEPYQRPEGR